MILDPKTSKRIFELARDQQDEIDMPDDQESDDEETGNVTHLTRPRNAQLDEDDEEEDMDADLEGQEDAEEIFVSGMDFHRSRTLNAVPVSKLTPGIWKPWTLCCHQMPVNAALWQT